MKSDTRIEALLGPFQTRLRAYAFGSELDAIAVELMSLLEVHRRRRADLTGRTRLKALALMAEYLDAHGRSQEAAELLRLTVEELIDGGMESEDLRLMRQRVWCCLAFALTHLRANRIGEAGTVITRMRGFVEDKLVQPEFPCHGTVALLRYYEGLWHRNAGDLNQAAKDLDVALDQTRLRFEDKRKKYEGLDPDRLRRELIYSRVMTSRILGFGQGGIALARGRYVEARGWLIGASQILSNLGQETWRKSLEVYSRSATVMLAESAERLRDEGSRLQELHDWFAVRNRRNGFVAGAFGLLAAVRVRQIEAGTFMQADLKGLRKRIEVCLRDAYADAGPLSGSAALGLTECLMRARDFGRCEAEMKRLEKRLEGEEIAELRVLQAELWIETGREEAARGVLEELVAHKLANRGYRARAWALLALCEKRAGRSVWAERAMLAAREALGVVQDEFARAMVVEIGAMVEARVHVEAAMPYQGDGEDPLWCDVDHNLEMARLNVAATVHAKFPDYGVAKLAAVMQRGHSWLYALLARHRGVPWVEQVLRNSASR
jgi:tetratricopeptide (TPR) repeat protein